MEGEKEYWSEEEILGNFPVNEDEFENLLKSGVVTSKMENGRRVFHLEEIKILMQDKGHPLGSRY